MDHEIRPLTQKEELAAYARIAFDAYPGFEMEDVSRLESYLVKIAEKAGNVRPMGAFRNGVLTGGMLVYDYSMNYRDAFLPVGGVGLVAVDLLRCDHLLLLLLVPLRGPPHGTQFSRGLPSRDGCGHETQGQADCGEHGPQR